MHWYLDINLTSFHVKGVWHIISNHFPPGVVDGKFPHSYPSILTFVLANLPAYEYKIELLFLILTKQTIWVLSVKVAFHHSPSLSFEWNIDWASGSSSNALFAIYVILA